MKYRGILFDLDGTLLDTTELIVKSFQHTFRVHYNRDITPAEIHPFFGQTLRAAMEHLGPDKVDELIATYRDYNLTHHEQELYNAGTAMAIVTSKTQGTALRGLRLFNLDKYITAVIGVEQCQKHKPDPEPVLTAIKELGLTAADCLMVGDSPHDIISAKRAGAHTAAVRWTQVPWQSIVAEKPDYILNTMEDLLSICEISRTK
ncbi:HAD-superfamily hydrolase, subfamily IA, variant 1 [Thermosinus carboxydivorans Nor1]|uniref:HAD-superfamily hydrolase, subfamily IA, variant 1 n=1 Tax=Thermosinus carboxydivorans Nor1 TaxID=401526 RepID=A1HTS7_9FIRM|nr:HAD-IA family hydrolase [Thermosinus carboxydivorans]EAX46561.1 HAD-superfamily hydrolase, subfamily IA, variant 1 [Thermosinus carboxydivorans Nor1]